MNRSVLVLSKEKAGAIRKIAKYLKSNHYKPILVSDDVNDPNAIFCDNHIYINWDDDLSSLIEKISTLDTKPSHVVCILESLTHWQYNINNALNLNNYYCKSLLNFSDKSKMRQLNNTIKYHADKIKNFDVNDIDFYPCILKPALDTGGSRNVYTCQNKQDLLTRINSLKKHLNNLDEKYIVEQYIHGTEYTVDGYVNNMIFSPVFFSEKLDFDYQNNEDGKHIISPPINLTQQNKNHILQQLNKLIKQASFQHGWLHIEFRVINDHSYIIEINPRCGGRMYGRAINYVSGLDPFSLVIQLQLNTIQKALIINKSYRKYQYLLLINFRHDRGQLYSHTPLSALKKYDNFIDGYIIKNYCCSKLKLENIFAEFLIGGRSLQELMGIEELIRAVFHYKFKL